jgi:hypothetical protein
MPTVEMPNPIETQVPPEVLEMDKNLVGEARVIFKNNHELVKEAMFGMGSRKAKEVLDNLAKCRKDAVEALKIFRAKKERIYH